MKYFSDLYGRVLVDIHNDEEVLRMKLIDGTICELYHEQDCCEYVRIESINGDLRGILGDPIIVATEEQSGENPPDVDLKEIAPYQDSYTWTTYTLGTANCTVTIRWYGESNGYYSEDVYFRVIPFNQINPDNWH